jgi:protein-S-isoprenylcysteine O-methyltransferase Ste14
MFVIIRALTYAALFVGFVLVFLPGRVLSQSGIVGPPANGVRQVTGVIVVAVGAALALWCVATFALVGRGTPAPFDPPRRLVVQGPYRVVRNPMYVGAVLALGGAAVFYESFSLLGYAGLFLVVTHAFVVWYEEPTLRKTFGTEYREYCGRVGRWWPRV